MNCLHTGVYIYHTGDQPNINNKFLWKKIFISTLNDNTENKMIWSKVYVLINLQSMYIAI